MLVEKSMFESITINKSQLKNRIAVAPMSRVSTNGNGVPTAQMEHYYRRYAEGGFGLIITEGVYTDRYFSQAYPNQPGITNDQQQEHWQKIVNAAHDARAKIFLQLMHAGALSQHLTNTRSASSVQPMRNMLPGYSQKQGSYPMPHAMNLTEIDAVIDGFAKSASRAEQAGFDGVEIHGANGYLLDQFLTEYTNTREDQYGGSIENRCRLSTDIIHAIKNKVSHNLVVGIRVSQGKVNDFDYIWPGGIGDGEIIFTALSRAGADYLHFASEGKGFDHGCHTRNGESLPKLARNITNLPVIANGGMDDLVDANRILKEGHGDLIALGTGALANPDWPTKIKNDEKLNPFNPAMFAQGVTIETQLNWEKKHRNQDTLYSDLERV